MKGLTGLAVVLGLAGTVLGIIALLDSGGGTTEQTLNLTGGKETRIEFEEPATSKGHPIGNLNAWSSNEDVSGDKTGEYMRTCVPIPTDEIECSGAFLLEDGDIEVDLSEEADAQDPESDGAIIGGTGEYEGAGGTMHVNWEENTYTLDLILQDD
jgi:hypothetical protein